MIGVLDLQGDVVEHLDHLDRLGLAARRVKEAGDLENLAGLILPGGESTCIARLMAEAGLDREIREAFQGGLKLWGTCAGAILLATTVKGERPHLGLVEMVVERNSFGSQLDSFVTQAVVPAISPEPLELVFIRAPKILEVGRGVRVLLSLEDYIAAAETDGALVTVFHPELTPSAAFHAYFAAKCGVPLPSETSKTIGGWSGTSWTRYSSLRR